MFSLDEFKRNADEQYMYKLKTSDGSWGCDQRDWHIVKKSDSFLMKVICNSIYLRLFVHSAYIITNFFFFFTK